jgi:hypothetical protein
MGYDMRLRRADADEAAAVAAAQTIFNATCAARDALPKSERGVPNLERAKREGIDPTSEDAYDGMSPRYRAAADQVHAAYAAMRDAERSYFRLNMFGMGRYCDLMSRIGMTFDDPSDRPDWPEPEDYGTTYDEIEQVENREDYPDVMFADEQLRRIAAYRDARDRLLSWHGVEVPGIPDHKFSSNDGWIVLPAECEAAVRIWRQFVSDEGDEEAAVIIAGVLGDKGMDYWLKWIAYLASAVNHGGFEVH